MIDTTFITGIIGSLLLVAGAAWPENRKHGHPARSPKNWLLGSGAVVMLTYSLLGYSQGGPVFFAMLQGLAVLASVLMMLDTPDSIDTPLISVCGAVLVIWSLYLFEGYGTVIFILGLCGIGLGYAFNEGTLRRSIALTAGSALIALYSYMEASWIFFWLNVFFSIFSAYWVYAGLKHRQKNSSSITDPVRKKLILRILWVFPLALVITGLILFLPAGTFNYWQGWLFMAVLYLPFLFVITHFIKHDPALLVRRMQYKEKESRQRTIIKVAGLFYMGEFLLPGFDFRYGWSDVPVPIVLISNLIVILSYGMVYLVFKENSYAARTIRVEKGQKVISTGLYSVIRHPMYTGMLLMFAFIPTALGSYWALLFFIPILIPIIFRIFNEEEILMRELDGYKEYMKKVRYRLIPGIW
jgi:protein-S-isoprenylcysteine O-methyltransferase Ste14